MAVAISAAIMAPNCTPALHGPSRLSRASSSVASMPPPPPALAKMDALQDALFTEEELQSLMSGHYCELLSFPDDEDHLQPSLASASPLLSLQLQAHQLLLCREDDEDDARFQFQEPPPPFAGLDALEEPISDEDIDLLAPLFCDEEIMALCNATAQHQQFSSPHSDDPHAGKKRRPPSPPWPSCIADDDDEVEQAGPPPPLPPPTKKARTKTKSRSRRERSPPPPPIKKARTQTKTRSRPEHAAARAERLRRNLRKWHSKIATRILTRQFRAPELSRGRTALRCQCTELALAADGDGSGFGGCCPLHQDALPEDNSRAWMLSVTQGHVPLVGGPGQVLVPAVSAGSSKATVLQYQRWRRSVSMPSRFFVQCAVEKASSGLARAGRCLN